MSSPAATIRPRWLARMFAVTVLVGIGAGLAGLVVAIGLRLVQHLAYGYDSGTFLDGVVEAPPPTRLLALSVAGVLGAVAWWALRRWGRPVVSVVEAVAGARMPALASLANAAIQVVVVGLGASIGREVAPRELGALFAEWVTDRTGVSARERRILVACGAGAGLAAVYSVPLGGAVFTLEILLTEISLATALPALTTSVIATVVAHLAVPFGPIYRVPHLTISASLLVFALVVGPILGFAGAGFSTAARFAETRRPKSWVILIVMPLTFAAVGLTSMAFPQILGNGRALGQTAFDAVLPLGLLALLLALKAAATMGTIGSGAAGGTLTPSLALGAAAGAVLGALWQMMWPGTGLAAFAVIGAGAVLATTMRAPLTALVLVAEFTGQAPTIILPLMIAVAGAVGVAYVMRRSRITGVP